MDACWGGGREGLLLRREPVRLRWPAGEAGLLTLACRPPRALPACPAPPQAPWWTARSRTPSSSTSTWPPTPASRAPRGQQQSRVGWQGGGAARGHSWSARGGGGSSGAVPSGAARPSHGSRAACPSPPHQPTLLGSPTKYHVLVGGCLAVYCLAMHACIAHSAPLPLHPPHPTNCTRPHQTPRAGGREQVWRGRLPDPGVPVGGLGLEPMGPMGWGGPRAARRSDCAAPLGTGVRASLFVSPLTGPLTRSQPVTPDLEPSCVAACPTSSAAARAPSAWCRRRRWGARVWALQWRTFGRREPAPACPSRH